MHTVIVITTLPYGNPSTFEGLNKAFACLENGSRVSIFLYGDGVYNALKGINPPQDEHNPLKMFMELADKGVKIYYCQSAGLRRGVDQSTASEIFEKSSLSYLATLLIDANNSYCY